MNNRRKRYLIDSTVQGALARRIVIHWIIFCVLVATIMPFCQLLFNFRTDLSFFVQLQFHWMEMAPMFIIMFVTLPIFVYDTIRFSNRFAGPMFRFHSVVKQLAAGEDVQPVRLRTGDAWTEFADDFNAMVRRLTSENRQETADTANCVNDSVSGTYAESPNS